MTERRRDNDRRSPAPHPLAQDLAMAIDTDALEILFQPQFGAGDGHIAGGEALARWHHPRRGELAGDKLFGIAARSNLTETLSRHVSVRSMRLSREWPADMQLSLNVTAADLAAPDFARAMREMLTKERFAPERLTLEITEQALVRDLDRSAAQLQELVRSGMRVALDDFGAGFCNFRYLKILPLYAIKLDRSMVDGIAYDERDLAVLRGIVAMARALDLKVIAEGVETEAQREAVAREGCDVWQGFLGARPLPAAAFLDLAERQAEAGS